MATALVRIERDHDVGRMMTDPNGRFGAARLPVLPDLRLIPSLDLRQLHYLVTLAEKGSITAAAAALEMAQPSLSDSIGRIERKLQTPLFVRDMRGVQLTEAGQIMVSYSRGILSSVGAAIAEISQLGGAPKGAVSVGFPPSLSLLLSVPLAETIHTEYPDIRLHVAEALSGDVLSWILAERLDFGCVYEIPDRDAYMFRPMLDERLFLVTAADNWPIEAQGEGPKVRGSELEHLPLVLPSISHGARKVVERFARGAGITLNVIMEIDSLAQIISMVRRASAYTILPHAAVVEYIATGELILVDIVDPEMRRTAYLVRKRSRPVGRGSAEVEQVMTMVLAEMVKRFDLQATVMPTADAYARSQEPAD